jgi:transcriptional regulator with XRE-family HTH domain
MNERFKQIRKKSGLNQKDFAEKLGTTQANISRYEKGELDINTEIQRKLAEHFGVNIHWLVTGKGEQTFKEANIKQVGTNINTMGSVNNSTISITRSNDSEMQEILQDLYMLPDNKRKKIYHLIKAELTEIQR